MKPDFSSLTPLLAPRSVAVIGASDDPTRIGGRPIAYMRAQGFRGAILPVNPKRAEIQGLPAYPTVESLPETPDVAIVAVPAVRRFRRRAPSRTADGTGASGTRATLSHGRS